MNDKPYTLTFREHFIAKMAIQGFHSGQYFDADSFLMTHGPSLADKAPPPPEGAVCKCTEGPANKECNWVGNVIEVFDNCARCGNKVETDDQTN